MCIFLLGLNFGCLPLGRYLKVLRSPKVCLCGSTRFKDEFLKLAKEFTLKGYIVTMPMVFIHSGDSIYEIDKDYLVDIELNKPEKYL